MRHLDYPRCETLNCWRSFDAHFQDGAGSVLFLRLPIKEANTSVMTICNECPLWLPRMQDLKSLTLRWRSFPWWGKLHFSTYFNHKGGQYIQKEHRRTIVNISRLTVRYLNVTMNRTTRNARPEIGPHGSSHTRRNPRVDGYRARYGPTRSSGSVFEPFWNRTELVFLSQQEPLAGHLDPLVTVASEYTLTYAPNCTWRYTLTLLCPMLPSIVANR